MSHAYMCAQKDTQTYEASCAHKKHSELARQKRFFGSLQRQRDASFAHCQGHNGWRLACRMHVYAGGSDHMLYQRITVLTPGITASCSSVQPSFLAFIVVIVLFQGLMMVRMMFEKNIQKFTSRDLSKLEVCFS